MFTNNELPPEIAQHRHADHEIDPLFLKRWSPRAFSSEPVDDAVLMSVFECARWAASSNNEQPWRFILARSEADRKKFLDFLAPGNQVWAKAAPVLVLIVSKKTFDYKDRPNKTYQFDAGTASGYMSLGCALNGLIAHGMAGFDGDLARATLGILTNFEPIAVFAIGKQGDSSTLPPDLAAREVPSGRRPIAESIMEGHFIAPDEAQADTRPQ
ncbi:MAG: hypothetical protein JWN98_420 [Abditibacteriota bacterium]|nr:hypothetical protein [Abditibacteriota bacterium]